MKEINVSNQKKKALVDDEDYERLSSHKWLLATGGGTKQQKYLYRSAGLKVNMKMHREILNLTDPLVYVMHVNGDAFDNRKENLLITTSLSEISAGQKKTKKKTSSKYKGVYWKKREGKWIAAIRNNYKLKHLGYFHNEDDAARAYNEQAIEYWGDFARINEIK